MFVAKIRETDRTIIDVDDSGTISQAEWFVRNSDLEVIIAVLVPGTNQSQHQYTLTLLEPITEGTWELVKNTAGIITTTYVIFASAAIIEPAPQEVLDFISWVGEEEAKKLSSLNGETISYNVIETAIEQAGVEFDFMLSNLSIEQQAIYTTNRAHLVRTIARYRLDRICPRAFVKADYDALRENIASISSVLSGGREIFGFTTSPQSHCPPRRGNGCGGGCGSGLYNRRGH